MTTKEAGVSFGDMPADEFRKHGHAMVEWIARFMENPERFPVLARVAPGDILNARPESAPEAAESFDAIIADFDEKSTIVLF